MQLFSTFRAETKHIHNAVNSQSVNGAIYLSGIRIVVFSIFVAYSLEDHAVNVVDVFIALGLYQSIRLSIMVAVPWSVQLGSQALVAIGRIQVSPCYGMNLELFVCN